MGIEDIRRHARRLGIKNAARMTKAELTRAIQAKENSPPCFDQQWCRPSQHQRCDWKNNCKATLEPVRGLVISSNVIIGYQVSMLLSSTYGWKMQVVHTDKQAYDLILQGDMDVVVADIDGIDLGGLAVLAHTKHHWPSIKTFAITENGDFYIKKLARDMGGSEGFFYLKKGRIELDPHMGLGAQLIDRITKRNHPHLPYVSATK